MYPASSVSRPSAGWHQPGTATVPGRRHASPTPPTTTSSTRSRPMNIATTAVADLEAIKARQQAAWSSGDYALIGTTLQIVGEQLCETLDVRSGEKVLDVAAGNGNIALAAARRGCELMATDYVPALLERARERAAAERLDLELR